MFASVCFTFASHLSKMRATTDECFPDYYFIFASSGLYKKPKSYRSSHWKVFYKIGASFLKELKSCRFTAAMWTILDAVDFLDPPLTFTCTKNDGKFIFNAISVYKVYIDFWIKLLERLFVNDKQMLTEWFKSFLTL